MLFLARFQGSFSWSHLSIQKGKLPPYLPLGFLSHRKNLFLSILLILSNTASFEALLLPVTQILFVSLGIRNIRPKVELQIEAPFTQSPSGSVHRLKSPGAVIFVNAGVVTFHVLVIIISAHTGMAVAFLTLEAVLKAFMRPAFRAFGFPFVGVTVFG